MTILYSERAGKTQIGFCNNSTAAYAEGGGDMSFATGIVFLARMRLTLPRGATVNSATLAMQVIAKNSGTAQTSFHTIRAHASGDSPMLQVGVAEAQRAQTSASVSWTNVWPVNPPGDVIAYHNVVPLINEILARSDYQPGGFITFMMTTTNENGSDMSVRANNDFAMTWQLTVDYTENYRDLKCSINIINNPHNEAMPAIDASPLPFWGQNQYYGAMVDPVNQGTIARDTAFTRLPGAATLRFTTGTPPTEPGQVGKATGPYTNCLKENAYRYIFAGWIYIPSTVTTGVRAGDPYLGGQNVDITARDQWVPFCTHPTDVGTGRGVFWPAIRILGSWQAGWQFWLSEPTIMISPFRQMPFNGHTPDVVDPGGVVLVDNKRIGSGQAAVKEWTPRTAIVRNGALRRAARYIKRPDGILQLAEPIKGGVTAPNMPAIPMDTYPAGKTISEF